MAKKNFPDPHTLGPKTGDDLRKWRIDMNLDQHAAANFLDYSVRMLQRWEAGSHEIPTVVSIVCHQAAEGLLGPIV